MLPTETNGEPATLMHGYDNAATYCTMANALLRDIFMHCLKVGYEFFVLLVGMCGIEGAHGYFIKYLRHSSPWIEMLPTALATLSMLQNKARSHCPIPALSGPLSKPSNDSLFSSLTNSLFKCR